MNPKLTAEHLEREAIVSIRQSTPNQVRRANGCNMHSRIGRVS